MGKNELNILNIVNPKYHIFSNRHGEPTPSLSQITKSASSHQSLIHNGVFTEMSGRYLPAKPLSWWPAIMYKLL